MRLPNSYGSIVKLSGKRRRPYAARRAGDVPRVYDQAYKHLKNLHQMPFIDIRKRHIQAEIDNCKLSVSSLQHMKSLVSMIYKYAIDLELVTINQASGIELPTREKSTIHAPFTQDEIAALWQHTEDFAARIALILIYTGLRPSELLTITTDHVFLKDRYMQGGLKTAASKNRIIPLADKILPFIRDMYSPDNKYLVMVNGHNLSYSAMKHYWLQAPYLNSHLPHDGRHTCATLLSNAGIDLKIIQMILGHRSRNITEHVYMHKSLEQLLIAINKI